LQKVGQQEKACKRVGSHQTSEDDDPSPPTPENELEGVHGEEITTDFLGGPEIIVETKLLGRRAFRDGKSDNSERDKQAKNSKFEIYINFNITSLGSEQETLDVNKLALWIPEDFCARIRFSLVPRP
jgi:hypothetical protein